MRCPNFLFQHAATAALLATGLSLPRQVFAQVSVSGACNIFGAGTNSAPAPAGQGGGIPPVVIGLTDGAHAVYVEASGLVTIDGPPNTYNAPDGGAFYARTAVLGFNNLSGVRHDSRTMFLVGVFLGPGAPSSPPPPSLNFSVGAIGTEFGSLSPLLQQLFFLGDGLNAAGHRQRFVVPDGGTRLFLGFADSFDGSTITGLPGYYIDNDGALLVSVFSTCACTADTDDASGTGTCDGGVGIEDLLYYLGLYDAGLPAADIDDGNARGVRDGGVGIEDLLYYLSRYDAGC